MLLMQLFYRHHSEQFNTPEARRFLFKFRLLLKITTFAGVHFHLRNICAKFEDEYSEIFQPTRQGVFSSNYSELTSNNITLGPLKELLFQVLGLRIVNFISLKTRSEIIHLFYCFGNLHERSQSDTNDYLKIIAIKTYCIQFSRYHINKNRQCYQFII